MIKGVGFGIVLAAFCTGAAAGSLATSAVIHAATQSHAGARRAHVSRALDLSGPRSSLNEREVRLSGTHSVAGVLDLRAANDVRSAGKPADGPITLHWQTSPQIVRVARQFRHNGLPIVRLWQSGQNQVASGLNLHGVPGIYFTQKIKG